jgi:hypothetical protein
VSPLETFFLRIPPDLKARIVQSVTEHPYDESFQRRTANSVAIAALTLAFPPEGRTVRGPQLSLPGTASKRASKPRPRPASKRASKRRRHA